MSNTRQQSRPETTEQIPLAYIEEAIRFAVANGWRPPVEDLLEEDRNLETMPAPPSSRDSLAGTAYEAAEFRHGLAAFVGSR